MRGAIRARQFSFLILSAATVLLIATMVVAQDEGPTADERFDRLFDGAETTRPQALAPSTAPAIDKSTGSRAVAPGAAAMPVAREGTFIVDRVGRLSKLGDGSGWQFTFDSDGDAMRDPPVIVLPNLKLMAMEEALGRTSRDLRFRVTGMLTEYRGRNHVLLEKVVVVPDAP